MQEQWNTITVGALDLRATMRSGQFFRYTERHDRFVLLTQGRELHLQQEGDRLSFTGAENDFVQRLFGDGDRYHDAVRRLMQDPVLRPIVGRYPGLRVMRQDLHETVIGFLCSSQSNIPKIRMNLELIAHNCGQRKGKNFFLPAPGTAIDEQRVRAAKTGYRARFIVQTNTMLTPDLLSAIQGASYNDAHEKLCALPGIGPKIADCICLFALGHGEAFPVDVHVLRAMRALFPKSRITSEKKAKAFAQRRWGPDAGLAQQLVFQWARDNLGKKRSRILVTA